MNTARIVGFASFITLTAVSVLSVARAQGQTRRVDLFVDDPRPVAEAIRSLTARHPVVITYEDPRYEYSGDTLDVTEQVRNPLNRNAAGSAVRVLVPKGGLLQVSYDVSADTGKPANLVSALDTIIETNNVSSSRGARFRVQQSGEVFHVIPTEAKDADGRWVEQTPILDTPITMFTEELNGHDGVQAILSEVSKATGIRVGLAAEGFLNSFFRYKGRIEANNEPARDVLLRVLHDISARITWLLFYDPTGKYYFFNVSAAADAPSPAISPELPDGPQPGDSAGWSTGPSTT